MREKALVLVDGIRCSACVTKIDAMSTPLRSFQTDLSSGSVRVSFSSTDDSMESIAQSLHQAGFKPYAILDDPAPLRKKALLRLGVAWFCLGNVMLFAMAEYFDSGSMDAPMLRMFRVISMMLTAVAIGYSADRFFFTAYRSLKQKRFDIYIPISAAIVLAYGLSVYHTVTLGEGVYFDSIVAIIALLLTGLFVQQKVLDKAYLQIEKMKNQHADFVLIKDQGDYKLRSIHAIKPNDQLRLLPGDICPTDAKLLSSIAECNHELISGEANDIIVKEGDVLPSGSVIRSFAVEVMALETTAKSFLMQTKLKSQELFDQKTELGEFTQKMTRVFFVGLLTFCAGIFFYHAPSDIEQALTYAIAGLLVACPCALGLAIPLVYATSLAKALKYGIMFRSIRALEQLPQVKTFIFDKTGTLTTGELSVQKWECLQALEDSGLSQEDVWQILLKLKSFSHHHIVHALSHWASSMVRVENETLHLKDVIERLGEGMNFKLGKRDMQLARSPQGSEATVSLWQSSMRLVDFYLADQLRSEAKEVVDSLRSMGTGLQILSGDQRQRCLLVAATLGISSEDVLGDAAPLDKLKQLQSKSMSAMVGNGFNDALAISKANVGVALGSAPMHTKSVCDIILGRNDLRQLLKAVSLSQEAKRKLKRSFFFAGFYNIITLSLAAYGLLSPVMAAILMPLSSVTIIFMSTGVFVENENQI
jgi:P-type E1-E2 ATPase